MLIEPGWRRPEPRRGAKPRWLRLSTYFYRSAPDKSLRPTQTPHGSYRTGRHRNELGPFRFEHLSDRLIGQGLLWSHMLTRSLVSSQPLSSSCSKSLTKQAHDILS